MTFRKISGAVRENAKIHSRATGRQRVPPAGGARRATTPNGILNQNFVTLILGQFNAINHMKKIIQHYVYLQLTYCYLADNKQLSVSCSFQIFIHRHLSEYILTKFQLFCDSFTSILQYVNNNK